MVKGNYVNREGHNLFLYQFGNSAVSTISQTLYPLFAVPNFFANRKGPDAQIKFAVQFHLQFILQISSLNWHTFCLNLFIVCISTQKSSSSCLGKKTGTYVDEIYPWQSYHLFTVVNNIKILGE
jgi:hypothetical protein